MLFCQKKKDKKNLKIWLKILFSKISEIISLNYSQKKEAQQCENTKEKNITLPFTRKSKHHYYKRKKKKNVTSLFEKKKLKIIFSFLYLEFVWFIQMAILPAAGKIFSFSPLAFRLPSNGSGYCCQWKQIFNIWE